MSWRKLLKRSFNIFLLLVVFVVVFQIWVVESGSKKMHLPDATTGEWQVLIVPGASVLRNGTPSDVLADRLLTALSLYQNGRSDTFLLSGDHGQDGYDEVSAMRDFLLERGVPGENIFLDHAGFDTYDTLYRAQAIFGVESAIIITQEFHLPRALFIADALKINAIGVIADQQPYVKADVFALREWPARLKAFFDVIIKSKPEYLGEPVSLDGDGRDTWDEESD